MDGFYNDSPAEFSYIDLNCSEFTAQKRYTTFHSSTPPKLQQAKKSDSLSLAYIIPEITVITK